MRPGLGRLFDVLMGCRTRGDVNRRRATPKERVSGQVDSQLARTTSRLGLWSLPSIELRDSFFVTRTDSLGIH